MTLERITLDDRASGPVDFFGYQHTLSISRRSSREENAGRPLSRPRRKRRPSAMEGSQE
jgi:hypothetical protein